MSDSNIPDNANQGCVGPQSEEAGKASACAGCPNQKKCASGEAKEVDPDIAEIAHRLQNVKKKVMVLSGKGGVGKSTFSAQLSFSLASGGSQVGLLDIDICGPSVPRMLGLENEEVHQSNLGWSPVYVEDNLGVMSIGFMLGKSDAVIWRGPRKNGLIKQFLKDVDWGDLDFLVIDTPPGTSDEHISTCQYLKDAGIDGAVIVTTPQEVAINDVRREVSFCNKLKMPILGIVENMSGFICPNCECGTEIFPSTNGGGEALAKEIGVPFLGKVPLDPKLVRVCEEGKSFTDLYKDSPTTKNLKDIIEGIKTNLN